MSTGTQNGLNNLYGRGGLGACHNEEKGLYMKLNISVVDKPKSSTKGRFYLCINLRLCIFSTHE